MAKPMKVSVIEQQSEFENSITALLTEKAKRHGYKAVYTVTCLTCNTQFVTGNMPPTCPNRECPEHKAEVTT